MVNYFSFLFFSFSPPVFQLADVRFSQKNNHGRAGRGREASEGKRTIVVQWRKNVSSERMIENFLKTLNSPTRSMNDSLSFLAFLKLFF